MPVPHLIVGPNGAGKTTLYERIVEPATHLPFINADLIARERWAEDAERQAYEAARIATRSREAAIAKRRSFVTETVFSHPSKLDIIRNSKAVGYIVTPHVVMIPEALAVRLKEPRKVVTRYPRLKSVQLSIYQTIS